MKEIRLEIGPGLSDDEVAAAVQALLSVRPVIGLAKGLPSPTDGRHDLRDWEQWREKIKRGDVQYACVDSSVPGCFMLEAAVGLVAPLGTIWFRMLDDHTLDILNMLTFEPVRGCGLASGMLDYLLSRNPQISLVVTSRATDDSYRWLLKRGFMWEPQRNRWELRPGLSKAIKLGGPAHLGKNYRQVSAEMTKAQREMGELQASFLSQFRETVNGWESAVELRNAAATSKMGAKTADMHLDRIRASQERAGRGLLRESMRKAWSYGRRAAGNLAPMTADEQEQLRRLQLVQQQYFANMLHDIDAGTRSMSLEQRTGKYADALQAAYNFGFVFADLSHDRWLAWHCSDGTVRPVEHCESCLMLSHGGRYGTGVYRAIELAKAGIVPKCDKLICWGACQCSLVSTNKPTGPAIGTALADMKIPGPESDSFTGMGRENREQFANRVKKLKYNWKGRV